MLAKYLSSSKDLSVLVCLWWCLGEHWAMRIQTLQTVPMWLSPGNSMSSSINESRDRHKISVGNSIDYCEEEANIMRKGWTQTLGIEIISLSRLQTVQGGLCIICKFLRSRWSSKTIVFWQKWTGCRFKSSSTALIFTNIILWFCCKIIPIEFPLENISCARDVWRRRKVVRNSGGVMVKALRSQEPPYPLITILISLAPWQSPPPSTHHSTGRRETPSSLKQQIFW